MKNLLLALGIACSMLTGCESKNPKADFDKTAKITAPIVTESTQLEQQQAAVIPDLPVDGSSKEIKKISLTDNISCTDSEYKIYKQYDEFLDANPSTPDYTLRGIFAKKVRMQPAALKKLYTECTFRWTKERPGEASALAVKAMAEDAARIRNSK